MADLEAAGKLDRRVEGLPDGKALAARAAGGKGLTRPELAVLLAYGKLTLFEDIVGSEAPDDPFFFDTLKHCFPNSLGGLRRGDARSPPAARDHRLGGHQ